jgi:phosphopantothenoylcysteine decarboxylase / phosphopantothenate---cysteine ligase
MMTGKKILLGITGSIAAYKSILLVRELVKAGAEVRVIMTPAARDFVTPLTLSTLSRNPVLIELFDDQSWSNHVMLGRWAHLFLIAPLSCNTLSKMAHGGCDNLLLATYLSATCPVMAAPAMDEDMWLHPSTRMNLESLQAHGVELIPVDKGELASGLRGEGRMAEPADILKRLEARLQTVRDLEGRKALVTAGPTYEPLDPVRFIGNHSSGKMGMAIAEELASRGAQVDLVLGPSQLQSRHPGIRVRRVGTAQEMYEACQQSFPQVDLAVMAAAVADYTPLNSATEKIKKSSGNLNVELVKTRDILASLGKDKKAGQLLVGFALETVNEKENALEKLHRKNADMIVLNSLRDPGAGFGGDSNRIRIFDRRGGEWDYELKSKQQVAKDIVDRIVNMLYA